MYLRMVTHSVHEGKEADMAAAYEQTIFPALRSTPGCIFAALLHNTSDKSECVSLTIWKTRQEALAYEAGGLYNTLVEVLRPFFAASNEWKLELSEDLSLEYTPISVEPTIERFADSVAGSEEIARLKAKPFAVQILSLTVQEDRKKAFEDIFASEIHPRFRQHKGFIELLLLRQEREYYIISFWDGTVDIMAPSGVDSVSELIESIRGVLPSFIRWKLSHRSADRTSASSKDIRATVHRCLVAEWFAH